MLSKSPLYSLGSFLAVLTLTASPAGKTQDFVANYKGVPYHDGRVTGGPQPIPGRVECAHYDLGGEGIAYHDSTVKNEGSGGLNRADGSYLNEFRMNESVDTSYTKFHDDIDNNPYNRIMPEENQLYVGWTTPGEWFNITILPTWEKSGVEKFTRDWVHSVVDKIAALEKEDEDVAKGEEIVAKKGYWNGSMGDEKSS